MKFAKIMNGFKYIANWTLHWMSTAHKNICIWLIITSYGSLEGCVVIGGYLVTLVVGPVVDPIVVTIWSADHGTVQSLGIGFRWIVCVPVARRWTIRARPAVIAYVFQTDIHNSHLPLWNLEFSHQLSEPTCSMAIFTSWGSMAASFWAFLRQARNLLRIGLHDSHLIESNECLCVILWLRQSKFPLLKSG